MRVSLHTTAALRKHDPVPSIVHARAEIEARVQEALSELKGTPAFREYVAASLELKLFDAELPPKMAAALQGRFSEKNKPDDKIARQARALLGAAHTMKERVDNG